jgi:hypothetical protein
MKRTPRIEADECVYSYNDSKFDSNVENFKRRRMLPPFSVLGSESRSFFERILNVKKIRELVFITKARTKER